MRMTVAGSNSATTACRNRRLCWAFPRILRLSRSRPARSAKTCKAAIRPLIPPENLDIVARDVFGTPGEATEQRLLRGHAVMALFRRGKGEVFNGGTTEWAHALKARDPFVQQITRNVLRRFGAYDA